MMAPRRRQGAPSDGAAGLGGSAALNELQTMCRADIEALQLHRIRALVARVWRENAFYRAKMEAAGIEPETIRCLDDFITRFPTSDKAEFLADQAAHPPFGTRLGVPREAVGLVNLTGGTSGQGQEVYGRTQMDIHTQGYLHALPWVMAGLRPGHMALNCVPAGGLTTGGWGPGEGFRIAGATALHAGGVLDTDAKIDLMLRFGGVSFIYASTNYLHRLTQALTERGVEPRRVFPDMAGLFIAAEGYPAEWAEKIEEIWGCTLHEGYGSTQGAGFAASTCDESVVRGNGRGLMYLYDWITLVEIVDPETGRHVASGEDGEMVITNLTIEGSPVIRFRTGDKARFVSHADTGAPRAWNAIQCGTIGRYDDMMKIRGNNVWPTAVDAAVFSIPEVAEYVGRVYTGTDGKTEAELRIALAQGAAGRDAARTAQMAAAVREAVKRRTNVNMQVVVVPRAELPEFSYKARRWSDERQQGYRLD